MEGRKRWIDRARRDVAGGRIFVFVGGGEEREEVLFLFVEVWRAGCRNRSV